MPSVIVGGPKNHKTTIVGSSSILNRSESLRSEISDTSLLSKKVSFNNDVKIRRIPNGTSYGQVVAVLDQSTQKPSIPRSGRLWINSNFVKEAQHLNHHKLQTSSLEKELLEEAKTVLNSLDYIKCQSSSFPESNGEKSSTNKLQTQPKTHKLLERSKSDLLPTTYNAITSLNSSGNSLRPGAIAVSDFLDVPSKPINPTKGFKIKKPARKRVGLLKSDSANVLSSEGVNLNRNPLARNESISSSSKIGSSSPDLLINFSSESPFSSISSVEGVVRSPLQNGKKLVEQESIQLDILPQENMSTRYNTNPRLSNMVNRIDARQNRDKYQRGSSSSPFRSSYFDRNGSTISSHNKDEPFSYTENGARKSRTTSLLDYEINRNIPSLTNGHNSTNGKSNREIIYAQIISGDKGKDGTPEKRTVHKKYSSDANGGFGGHKDESFVSKSVSEQHRSTPDEPSHYQKNIRHYVIDKENWKQNGNRNDSTNLLSNYKIRHGSSGGSQFGSRNNVTTVLLNSNDEDDSFHSTTIHNNDLFTSKNRSFRSSSSPPRLSERPFFFGDNRQSRIKTFDQHSSSSSPPNFQYSSSSREESPAMNGANGTTGIIPPPMKLMKDLDHKRHSTILETDENFIHPPSYHKTASSQQHTNYSYMNEKLGYLTPSEYSIDIGGSNRRHSPPPPRPVKHVRANSIDRHIMLDNEKKDLKLNGWNKMGSKITKELNSKNENSNKYKSTNYSSTLEKNHKNMSHDFSKDRTATLNQRNIVRTSNRSNSIPIGTNGTVESSKVSKPSSGNLINGGGGLISTLMRRNKDKKVKENSNKKIFSSTINKSNNTESKSKPRNKFLSLFFDKSSSNNHSTKKNGSSDKIITSNNASKSRSSSKSKLMTTDSEVDDAERKRDGEYHSWSSVDGSYHLIANKENDMNGGRTTMEPRFKEKLTRGKSYHFGDSSSKMVTEKNWYNNGTSRGGYESDDYRRDLANTVPYKSSTLGRPMRTSGYEDDISHRTKSLDRRLYPKSTVNRGYTQSSPPKIIITPNTPVIENDYTGENWFSKEKTNYLKPKNSSNHHDGYSSSKFRSKSSFELNDDNSYYRNHHPSISQYDRRHYNGNYEEDDDIVPYKLSTERLRYFGDTDVESNANPRYRNRNGSPSYISYQRNGAMDDPNTFRVHSRNQNHISRRDTPVKRYAGKNDTGMNSSEESESRFSKSSSRSVFLHAPTVAEIPPPPSFSGLQNRRTLSKDEISNYSGSKKQTRHLARSMSVLAPWRPRNDNYEIQYDAEGNKDSSNSKFRRPPKPPRSPNRKSISPGPRTLDKSKRSSSTEKLIPPMNFNKNHEKLKDTKSSTLSRIGANPIKRSKSIATDVTFPWIHRRKDVSK